MKVKPKLSTVKKNTQEDLDDKKKRKTLRVYKPKVRITAHIKK